MSDEDIEADSEAVIEERTTAPMQPFETRSVAIGFLVLAVGLLLTFVLPLVF